MFDFSATLRKLEWLVSKYLYTLLRYIFKKYVYLLLI